MKKVLWSATLIWLSACTTHDTLADSKSNWLRQCESQRDCGPGIDCACGVCTKACADTSACSGSEASNAVCVEPLEQGLPAACQAKSNAAAASGICLQVCLNDPDCGDQQRCAQGVCIGVDVEIAASTDAAVFEIDAGPATNGAASERDAMDLAAPDAKMASSLPGDASTATNPLSASVDVDCRPRYDIVGHFDSHCQYIGADLPTISCPDLATVSVGLLGLVVRHPDRIRVGVPVRLDAADPDVTIEVAFANSETLVQTDREGATLGTLIFDEFRIGELLSGRIVDVSLTLLPSPPFVCKIGRASFVADWGPGVRDI